MFQNDFQKIEFDALNKEILENSSKVHQVLTFCATVTGPLLGFLFSIRKVDLPFPNSMPFLALLPFAVIVPSIMLVRSSLNSTVRIASYIFVYYEEAGLGIGWQHAIQNCRTDRSKRGLGRDRTGVRHVGGGQSGGFDGVSHRRRRFWGERRADIIPVGLYRCRRCFSEPYLVVPV